MNTESAEALIIEEQDEQADDVLRSIRDSLNDRAEQIDQLRGAWKILPAEVKENLKAQLEDLSVELENLGYGAMDTEVFNEVEEILGQMETTVKWVPIATKSEVAV